MASQDKVQALIAELPQYLPSGVDLDALMQELLDPSVPDSQLDVYKRRIIADPGAAVVEAVRSDAHTYALAAQDRAGEQQRKQQAASEMASDPVGHTFAGYLSGANLQKVRNYVNTVPADRRQALVEQLAKEWSGKGQGSDISAMQSPADQASALVSAGKDFNFSHLMTDDERAQTLPQDVVGYVLQGVDTKGLNLDQLRSRLGSLSGGELWRAAQSIRGQIQQDTRSHPGFLGLLSGSGATTSTPNVQGAINKAVQTLGKAGDAAPGSYQGPAQPPTQHGYGKYVTPPAATQVPNLQTDLPKDNNAYLAGYLGISDAQLQQQYQSYVGVVNQTMARMSSNKDINVRPLPMQEWVDSQVNNLEGAYKPILDYYSQSWAINHGTRIPPDLMVQLRTAVKNATPAALKAMDQAIVDWQKFLTGAAAGGSTAIAQQGLSQQQAQVQGVLAGPSSVLPSMPFLEDIVTQYEASPVGDRGEKAAKLALQKQFMSTLGRMPSTQELDQLWKADQITQSAYFNTQTVTGTNLTFGQYNSAAQRATSLWQKYFNKAPSQKDITFAAGFQDEQQLQDWVYAQPSHLKGTNIGDYTALHDAGDKVSKELWNTPGTSGLTGALASAMGKGG